MRVANVSPIKQTLLGVSNELYFDNVRYKDKTNSINAPVNPVGKLKVSHK
jgi:hypothetical protein